ncbi:MAG TPA: cell wall hydrolase [Sphingobacteriaceae bacterium]|nr:cell wall hydrolase [Sphingobacteriaceae bacterium]
MLTTDHTCPRRWRRPAAVALLTLFFLALFSFPASAPSLTALMGSRGADAAQVHTVSPGESLWLIAQRYGTTVGALREANGLGGDLIRPGQRLTIPQSASTAWAAPLLTPAEMDLLARLVRAEAEDQPYAGKVAVAAVVLNRTRSSLFPNGVWAVVYEPYQFEPVMNGQINLPARPTDRQAVADALSGWDPSYGALYFFNPAKTANAFLWSRPVTVTIGDHRFTR